ncbi:MAG: DUF2231 domain-containing protein [Desulfovibrionales bacterium]
MAHKEREFTMQEVAGGDGREGRPVYIVFERGVYDVTESPLWKKGSHMRMHQAGVDLTDQLASAPHWGEVFTTKRVKRVGVLQKGEAGRGLPESLQYLFRHFPLLRRHPHPITVHFPTAYFLAAAFFLLMHTIFPGAFGFPSELASAALLVLGVFFTIFAIITGFFTLWVNYRFKIRPVVKKKLIVTAVLLVIEVLALGMRYGGPVTDSPERYLYLGLVLLLALGVVVLGYFGGEMVFPTKAK